MATALASIKVTDPRESDLALFALLREGQERAMVELFDRYSKLVYSTALRILKDSAAAEDVMQDLFMQMWRKPPAVLEVGASLAGWFVVISRNRAIDVMRRRAPTCPIDESRLASAGDPSAQADKNFMLDRLRLQMEDLPVEQKLSLELAFFEGLTHGEIAARTGHPLGTVKTRIRCALRALSSAVNATNAACRDSSALTIPAACLQPLAVPPSLKYRHRSLRAKLP